MTLPYQRDSDTSADAADKARPKAPTWRRRVYLELRRAGASGLTDEEIQDRLGMNPSTQRPRRVELVELGMVRDSGQRRPTYSGRRATVWVTTWPGEQTEMFQEGT